MFEHQHRFLLILASLHFILQLGAKLAAAQTLTQKPIAAKSEAVPPDLDLFERQVFRITNVHSELNYFRPYTFKESQRSNGSGLLLDSRRILTNAHVVADAKFITAMRTQDSRAREAKVLFRADNLDLAIIELEDAIVDGDLTPVSWGDELPRIATQVQAVGFPTGGDQLSITSGVVSRLRFGPYSHSGYHEHLLIQVDSSINPGNSGGPVYAGNKVVGISVQSMRSMNNISYIISLPVVRRFLKDIEDGVFHDIDELASMEVTGQALENAAYREFLGLDELKIDRDEGALIQFVPEGSLLHGTLRAGDVLLAIDGITVGPDNRIAINRQRIDFRHAFDRANIGDRLSLKLVRERKVIETEVTIQQKRKDFFERGSTFVRPPDYLIYGGLTFTYLSRNLLEAYGDSIKKAPSLLRFAFNYKNDSEELRSRERLIVLTDILPSRANAAAERFQHSLLLDVNGKPVRNLRDLKDMLSLPGLKRAVFGFYKERKPLILNNEELRSVQESLLARFKIAKSERLSEHD